MISTRLFLICIFCASIGLNAQKFSEVSLFTGLTTTHDGDAHSDTLKIGSGVTWLDANADGFPDLYLSMRTGANQLYINQGDGTFIEQSAQFGTEDSSGDGGTVVSVDFNNDGLDDLFLANGGTNRLLQNQGGTGFIDVTLAAGLSLTDQSRSVSASFHDYNEDGFLDLYIVNNIPIAGNTNASAVDQFFKNNGNGTFTDISNALTATGSLAGNGFSAVWTDLDNDRDADLIVTNDCSGGNPIPIQVFRNDGEHQTLPWTFTEIGSSLGLDLCIAAKSVSTADFNRDGWVDVFFSNNGSCYLFKNINGTSFSDVSASSLVGIQSSGNLAWGSSFSDVNMDGWPDLFLTCGSQYQTSVMDPQANMLFINNANGVDFSLSNGLWEMDDLSRSRRTALADYDLDGDEDVLVINYGEPVQLHRNDRQNNHNSVRVSLQGETVNGAGVGAKLILLLADSTTQTIELSAGTGLGGNHAQEAIFGIGALKKAEELTIWWNSKNVQKVYNLPANEAIIIKQNIKNNQISYTDVSLDFGITQSCVDHCVAGAGATFVDFNDDGWDDLTFGTVEGDSVLFFQNVNGTFVKIPGFIGDTEMTMQVIYFDIENDGDLDIYSVNRGAQNRLYENDGNMNFTDITVSSGLTIINDLTSNASIGDYNRDGWSDIYVGNWDPSVPNFLFRNNGDLTFTEVHASVGLVSNNNVNPLTNATSFIDINNDGWPEIYVSADRQLANTVIDQSIMYLNNGGTFTDISASSNTDVEINAMNVGPGDYDNDGDLDIWVSDDPDRSLMFRNNGDLTFTEVAIDLGVAFYEFGWAGSFLDADLDLDLDLYCSAMLLGNDQGSHFYINEIDQDTFLKLNPSFHLGDTLSSFSHALGDYNNDGLIDIAVNNESKTTFYQPGHHQIWKNETETPGHYLKIKLKGSMSNARGIGSWIELWINGQKYVRYTTCGTGYLTQNSYIETIGMGLNYMADSVIVRWPSGHVSKLQNIGIDRMITIEESTRLYVDITATGDETGYSWDHAYTNLADALAVAQISSNKEIWVADGTYSPAGNNRHESFLVSDSVLIYGGFSGDEAELFQREPAVNQTVITGDMGISNYTEDNAYHVLMVPATTQYFLIDGITIANGHANGYHLDTQQGGAIYSKGSGTLKDVVIQNCKSTLSGSGIMLNGTGININLEGVITHNN